MPDFECRLKTFRQMKNMTQEQLATQVGMRRETIMRLERGYACAKGIGAAS